MKRKQHEPQLSEEELRPHYDRTTLAACGIDFERALASPMLRTALEDAEHAQRRIAALRAKRAAKGNE